MYKLKTIVMSSFEQVILEDNFMVFRFQNDTPELTRFQKSVHSDLIQFHFSLKGKASFIFNQGNYTLPLRESSSLLLYNPQKELPVHLEIAPNSYLTSVFISIQKLPGLFSEQADYIPFLS